MVGVWHDRFVLVYEVDLSHILNFMQRTPKFKLNICDEYLCCESLEPRKHCNNATLRLL